MAKKSKPLNISNNMCSTKILAHHGETFVSHCAECKTIYIWHINIMLNFAPEDFRAFRIMLSKLDFEDCSFNFRDDISRIIIKTPNSGINFTFTEEEWENFNQAINEGIYMQEIYSMMG